MTNFVPNLHQSNLDSMCQDTREPEMLNTVLERAHSELGKAVWLASDTNGRFALLDETRRAHDKTLAWVKMKMGWRTVSETYNLHEKEELLFLFYYSDLVFQIKCRA